MIKLNKQQCPNVLVKDGAKWTKEILDCKSKGVTPPDSVVGRYRHPEIKNAVRQDSFDKCIYCESKVLDVYHGDIEHIKPKSKYLELTFDWENLGFICAKCNNSKRDDYDESLPYVNPYKEEPSDFLIALSIMIFPRNGNKRGQITEKGLSLNRPELIESRKERIEAIKNLANNYLAEINTSLKKLLYNELQEEIDKNKPYSMCTSEFLKAYLPEKDAH